MLFAIDDERVVEAEATRRARGEGLFCFMRECRRVGALGEAGKVRRDDAMGVACDGHGCA